MPTHSLAVVGWFVSLDYFVIDFDDDSTILRAEIRLQTLKKSMDGQNLLKEQAKLDSEIIKLIQVHAALYSTIRLTLSLSPPCCSAFRMPARVTNRCVPSIGRLV